MYQAEEASNLLRYSSPAKGWFGALPVGNGHLGGMVHGGLQSETLSINEDTCVWGRPKDRNNPDASKVFEKVRELIRQGRVEDADNLFLAGMSSIPRYVNPYVPVCDLYINLWKEGFLRRDDSRVSAAARSMPDRYDRRLDLRTGLASVSYEIDGTLFTRECFASFQNDVLVYRYASSKPGALTLNGFFIRRHYDVGSCAKSGNRVLMDTELGEGGIRFAVMMTAVAEGERAKVYTLGDNLMVENADAVTFYIACTTTFYTPDPVLQCDNTLEDAMAVPYEKLKNKFIQDYQAYYGRVCLCLGEAADTAALDTDQRVALASEGKKDPSLDALFINYARYLLICSSQPGTQPANLQGIWNHSLIPPWDCNFTGNINLQMNYWPAEVFNLPEVHRPLFDFMERIRKSGRRTARELYGCRGFVAHHNTNVYADTAPSSLWSFIWPFAHVWMAMDLWYYYEYTLDESFLRDRIYPLFREACLFFRDFLKEDENGYLISSFSQSPENPYVHSASGQASQSNVNPAMDRELLRDLFTVTLTALERCKIDDPETEEYARVSLKKLRPLEIGRKGQLLEWDEEYEECVPHNGHKSHLYGFFPGDQITLKQTPELAKAVAVSMRLREAPASKDTGGWPEAWSCAIYARLLDGEKAYEKFSDCLRHTHANLFSGNPKGDIFQLDANCGASGAAAEMLLQSHGGVVYPLPALPENWNTGSVKGICARGGFVLDYTWNGGSIASLTVLSKKGAPLSLQMAAGFRPACHGREVPCIYQNGVYHLETKAGETYQFLPVK